MPYISTKTNIELAKEKQDALAAKYGRIISLVPGKTERWLMLSFDDKISMYFGGKGDEPMAYIELSLFGGASDAVYDKLTAAICDAVSAETGIAPANIYVKYEEAEHWGLKGSNYRYYKKQGANRTIFRFVLFVFA